MAPVRFRWIARLCGCGALALAACGGGGGSVGPQPERSAPSTGAASASPSPAGTAGSGGSTATPTPTATPSPTPTPTSTPSATPTPTPSPSPTSSGVTTAGKHIYLANHGKAGSSDTPSVTVYAASATGNVAPLATLAGSATGMAQIQFPAVDPAGNLYLSDQGASGGATAGSVSVFASGALAGNHAPANRLGGLYAPEGIAFDASGDVYVATESAIDVFPPNPTSASQPMATIAGSNTNLAAPYGIFVDATGKIYVALSNAIEVFAAGASGNVAPIQEFDTTADKNAGINSCLSIAADSAGNIYCANYNTSTIAEYAAGATGTSVTPTTVASDSTKSAIDEPFGIFIDAQNVLYVANYGNDTIAYAPTSSFGNFALAASTIGGSSTGIVSPYGIYVR